LKAKVNKNKQLKTLPNNRSLPLYFTTMSKILFGLFLTLVLMSCYNNQTMTENNQIENNNNFDTNRLVELSENLHGLWISDNYLKNIENNKSVFKSRKYDTKVQGFFLDKQKLQIGSAYLEGFTDYEGGYSSPITYEKNKDKFVNDLARLSVYPTFPDSFELNYDGKNILEMYFPKTKTSDRYRKLSSDFQTELRRLLISGNYKAVYDKSEIQFDNEGKVHNFYDFKYYELVASFGEGIEYDAIVFFKTMEGGNWSDGEIYKFEIMQNSLHLQHVQTYWETLEHVIGDEILVLDRE
jgi:hypothetical protein